MFALYLSFFTFAAQKLYLCAYVASDSASHACYAAPAATLRADRLRGFPPRLTEVDELKEDMTVPRPDNRLSPC